jgi:hypothetical protein
MSIGYDPQVESSDIIYPDAYFYLDYKKNTLYDYPSYLEDPEIKVTNDLIDQMKSPDFESKRSKIIAKWIDILQNKDRFIPEGEGVVTHDKIDISLLTASKVGAVAKIEGLWSPEPGCDHPIGIWV